jgi:hypothetical protein
MCFSTYFRRLCACALVLMVGRRAAVQVLWLRKPAAAAICDTEIFIH